MKLLSLLTLAATACCFFPSTDAHMRFRIDADGDDLPGKVGDDRGLLFNGQRMEICIPSRSRTVKIYRFLFFLYRIWFDATEGPCCESRDGEWTAWTSWSDCSATCNGGQQSRERTCNVPVCGGEDCSGSDGENQVCNSAACAINGAWSAWSVWAACSVTCGDGIQSRDRSCTDPAPANGGRVCSGPNNEAQGCNSAVCPATNGAWSAWSAWSSCPITCGGGIQSRARSCTNPVPANGGDVCSGPNNEVQGCNSAVCPATNGAWSAWSAWSSCSVTCGDGSQSRARSCTNPAPANGGEVCSGSGDEVQGCSSAPCPTNGAWSAWSAWSSCSVTCGDGSQSRFRSCTNPAPAFGGEVCIGSDSENQGCSSAPCPTNGAWSEWSAWNTCSATCDGGLQSRVRSCTNPEPANGGSVCSGSDSEDQVCATNTCQVD